MTMIEPEAPSSRSVLAAEKPASPPPTIRNSTSDTLELRLALLGERGEALARDGGLEQAGDALALTRERLGDRLLDPRVGRELDLADRRRGAVGERLGVGARVLGELLGRVEAVQDPKRVRA